MYVCMYVEQKQMTHDLTFQPFNRQQFLEPGESILMISMVKKLQKLSSKKVQLILTNKPKLIYVDPSKLAGKGTMIWSDDPNDLSVQVTSPSNFKICLVSPYFSFQSLNQFKMFKKATT